MRRADDVRHLESKQQRDLLQTRETHPIGNHHGEAKAVRWEAVPGNVESAPGVLRADEGEEDGESAGALLSQHGRSAVVIHSV